MLFFFLFKLCIFHLCLSMKSLHICKLYEDTHGKWILNPTKEPNKDENNKTKALQHFIGGNPGEALWFDKVLLSPSSLCYSYLVEVLGTVDLVVVDSLQVWLSSIYKRND